MPILSLAALTLLDAGPAGQMRAAAAAGWTCVGLRLQPLLSSDEAVAGDQAKERELRRLRRDLGLDVLEIGVFPIRPFFDVAALHPVLDLSAELGARFLVAPIEDEDLSRRADHVALLAEAGAPLGLRTLVEFNPYSACRTLGAARALLDLANHNAVGLCLDAFHLSRSGGSAEDAAAASAWIELLHFCDAAPARTGLDAEALRRESRTARRLPGAGALALRELLAALPHAPISLEAPGPQLTGSAEERARVALTTTRAWLDENFPGLRV